MLDCGIHPGLSGLSSLPFFDEVDLDTVDLMLVRKKERREREGERGRERGRSLFIPLHFLSPIRTSPLPIPPHPRPHPRSRTSTWTTAPPCPTWSATPISRAASS